MKLEEDFEIFLKVSKIRLLSLAPSSNASMKKKIIIITKCSYEIMYYYKNRIAHFRPSEIP